MEKLCVILMVLCYVPAVVQAQRADSEGDGLRLMKPEIRVLVDSAGAKVWPDQPTKRRFDAYPMPNAYRQDDSAVAMPNAYRGDHCVQMPNLYREHPAERIIHAMLSDSTANHMPDSTSMEKHRK